jgi:hypothetical protein
MVRNAIVRLGIDLDITATNLFKNHGAMAWQNY